MRRGLRCTGLSAGVRLRRPRAGRFQLCDAPERAEPRGGEGSASGRGVRGAEGRLGDARAGVGRLAAARGAAVQPGDRRETRVLRVSARRGRGNARESQFWACFLSSVYCFLDLKLERRRPRDYKPSPRVCAEEPRGLRGWLRGSRAPRSPRLLWTATPAEPLFLKLGRFADLSRKVSLVPGTLARLLSSAECFSDTSISEEARESPIS